jgi:hypothetical protein
LEEGVEVEVGVGVLGKVILEEQEEMRMRRMRWTGVILRCRL